MVNSQRVAWFEAAYHKIRAALLPEAPEHVTLSWSFPTKKRTGKGVCVGECIFEALKDHGLGFGGENFISLHPMVGEDIVTALATLVHEMIHHSLEPTVKHGKGYQVVAARVGLCKPWPEVVPDGTLQNTLRGIALELEREMGYLPVGVYVPPKPKERKPSAALRLRCTCPTPRTLTLSKVQHEKGAIMCGSCQTRFKPLTDPGAAAPAAPAHGHEGDEDLPL